ncbi:MAG TPA: bifunctional phosphopantothenoylcysteine decarboxylase/phosphopantothenate--cysteine ligase CoaBC [Pyrinomonadaceae bacterium]|nr:bifunctional phosphopantothenoylcysteine decarboxylase/phosphopantothenate--cysteine ligase CoaBC [Pyrinomonadaceae bacterium]
MIDDRSGEQFSGKRVALGVTGGIAAYKAIEVLRGLQRAGCEVRVAMTRHACEFIQPLTFRALSGFYVVVDDYSPDNPDPIAHITFSQTADLLVVAPATANTLAKFANGIADDFLTSTYLACTAPVLIAPAMNTTMLEHPATQRNLQQLRADGVHIIEPDEGEMACGTIGPGRLSEPERIVAAALEILRQPARKRSQTNDLAQERILITAGATREPIDPVRFISNRSSGRMGFALAEAARDRGAQVTVVAGVTNVVPPQGVRIISATSADEMHRAVIEQAENATIFIAAAAVADYRPVKHSTWKIKKSEADLELKLKRTPDILSEVAGSRRSGQIIVGFAAETDDLLRHAREKLTRKKLDLIVANDVSRVGSGFDSENNAVVILSRDDPQPIELPLVSKLKAAQRILDEIAKLRRASSAAKTASIDSR